MSRRGENIYKRKDGRWEARYIDFYDASGHAHYKSLYAKSYLEVKNKKQEACLQSPPAGMAQGHAGSSFGKACSLWLEYIKSSVKESTYVKYRNMIDTYVEPVLGPCHIENINEGILEQYFMDLLEHGKSDGTGLAAKSVSDIKSVIKTVLDYAVNEGWIDRCNISHIIIKQDSRQIRVLTQAEQRNLEQYLLAKWSNLYMGIYISLYTGIRLGELCALRWNRIDLEQKTITVEKTMLRLKDYSASSKKKTKVVETLPKSACSIRTIPIPDFLSELLYEKSTGIDGRAYLLTGKTDKFIEPRLMEYHFQNVMRRLGMKHANFHCLRHTFATRCVELGFDVKTLSVILGHSTIHITMNRYVHPTMDMKRNNMEKLGQLADASKSM